MFNGIGHSIYLSSLKNGSVSLDDIPDGTPVFLSLHMEEELSAQYENEIVALCRQLNEKQCSILADVSRKTLIWFHEKKIPDLAKRLNLWAVRIDDGFSVEEMETIAKEYPIIVNASTLCKTDISSIRSAHPIYAMHNYYPRKETGLDEAYFDHVNHSLKKEGLKVFAFIPGKQKRGPLYEGLPTLESQRNQDSYINYLEMVKKHHVDQVFLGDPLLDEQQAKNINLYIKKKIIVLPVCLAKEYQSLYNTVFTNRVDAPDGLIRIVESRAYASKTNKTIAKFHTVERPRGTITIDNDLYKRYCGEIQITKRAYPQDDKVNVIGTVFEKYLKVLDLIDRGDRFILKETASFAKSEK